MVDSSHWMWLPRHYMKYCLQNYQFGTDWLLLMAMMLKANTLMWLSCAGRHYGRQRWSMSILVRPSEFARLQCKMTWQLPWLWTVSLCGWNQRMTIQTWLVLHWSQWRRQALRWSKNQVSSQRSQYLYDHNSLYPTISQRNPAQFHLLRHQDSKCIVSSYLVQWEWHEHLSCKVDTQS